MEAAEQQAAQAFGSNYSTIRQYVDILLSRGVKWGVIGPREGERVWQRHILNSLALGQLIPPNSRVLDVGSGAGLPGIPLAVGRPDLRVTLVESQLRRASFLELAVQELGLAGRVQVIRGRVEELQGHYDVVTARAVARLARLVPWTVSLFVPDGQLLALKGVSASAEVAEARPILEKLGLDARIQEVRAHPQAEPARVVVVRRR